MKPSTARKLNIADGMILMVGVAIGVTLTRLHLIHDFPFLSQSLKQIPDRYTYSRWIAEEVASVSCLWLLALSPPVLLIRLRRPRPTVARLLRQPGTSACFAVALIMAIGSVFTAIVVGLEGGGSWTWYYTASLIKLFPYAGAAVTSVWFIQSLGRRWRPEPGAIDRLGRILGAGWIAMFLVGTLGMMLRGALEARSFEMMQNQWKALQDSEQRFLDQSLTSQPGQAGQTTAKKSLMESLKILRDALKTLESDAKSQPSLEPSKSKSGPPPEPPR